MRRREFLTILSGAAMVPLIWPDDAHAQQPRNSPTIGFLGTTTPTIWSANVTAFRTRLDGGAQCLDRVSLGARA
jgi:hypothetical protein